MQNFNYYDKTSELVELLKKEGKSEQANALTEAIITGSTGTEILMALRYYLGFILKLEDLSKTTEEAGIDLYNNIDRVLKE